MKLIFDKLFAISVIVIFSVVFLIVSIIVVLNLGFPIFYIADRVGKNNKKFKIIKFRTMSNHENTASNKIMIFLRKTNLDEFPQFFNVLMGDMSIVGPRPHDFEEDIYFEKNIPNYASRRKVKPGITGLSAVRGNRGGNNLERIKERTKMDIEYINNQNFFLDIKIILLIIITIFRPNH